MATATAEPTVRPTREQIESTRDTKAQLHTQEKFKVMIRRTQGVAEGKESPRVLSVNGYPYRIPIGVRVEVPESVYLILVQAGEVDPQRDKDEKHVPKATVQPTRDAEIIG